MRTAGKTASFTGSCWSRDGINVGESAEHSGFSNLSYFAKTYKKYMGELPSQAERKPKK